MRDKFNAFLTKQMFEPSLIGIFVNPFYLARIALLREIKTSGKEIVFMVFIKKQLWHEDQKKIE